MSIEQILLTIVLSFICFFVGFQFALWFIERYLR